LTFGLKLNLNANRLNLPHKSAVFNIVYAKIAVLSPITPVTRKETEVTLKLKEVYFHAADFMEEINGARAHEEIPEDIVKKSVITLNKGRKEFCITDYTIFRENCSDNKYAWFISLLIRGKYVRFPVIRDPERNIIAVGPINTARGVVYLLVGYLR
jgi:hypothetical protein